MSDVELLMDNARLRDEIEPFLDESVYLVDMDKMSVRNENEFLSSLLAWEKAPVLPIGQWFEPQLVMPDHQTLSDDELHQQLHQVIGRMYEKNILLVHTDHLSDRQLYCLIVRDILPAQEKKVVLPKKFLKWQCLDIVEDEESWLRFYASEEDRLAWAFETSLKLPPKEQLPFSANVAATSPVTDGVLLQAVVIAPSVNTVWTRHPRKTDLAFEIHARSLPGPVVIFGHEIGSWANNGLNCNSIPCIIDGSWTSTETREVGAITRKRSLQVELFRRQNLRRMNLAELDRNSERHVSSQSSHFALDDCDYLVRCLTRTSDKQRPTGSTIGL